MRRAIPSRTMEPPPTPVPAALFRRRYLHATPEQVWPWLVEPALARRYHQADLALPLSAPREPVLFTHRLSGRPLLTGTVTEVVPPRFLAFTLRLEVENPELGAPEPESRVSLCLTRYGPHLTCLELRHEGLLAGGEAFRLLDTAWDRALCGLKSLLETGRPLPWPGRRAGAGAP